MQEGDIFVLTYIQDTTSSYSEIIRRNRRSNIVRGCTTILNEQISLEKMNGSAELIVQRGVHSETKPVCLQNFLSYFFFFWFLI